MKNISKLFILLIVIVALAACNKKNQSVPEDQDTLPPPPIAAVLTITEEAEVGGIVHMEVLVTQGEEKVTDASEVNFEIWEEGKKPESRTIDSVNNKDGTYSAETTFDHDGQFHIQVHVTARGYHTMPVKAVTVGDGGDYEEVEGHGHFHKEGFDMHLMKPTNVKAGKETKLTVHIELDEKPLEKARVRYEIWSENDDVNRDWIEVSEVASGEYSSKYVFKEAIKYIVNIHVEDKADLHEHLEYEIEVTE